MNLINDGGPAFPIPPVGTGDPRDGMSCGSSGMSLRDWFAGRALPEVDRRSHGSTEAIAMECYQIADALIAAREKGYR